MKTLYLDCGMGAAGDMLAAALLELLPDADAFLAEVNALGIPGVKVEKERAVRCGIVGTHLSVRVDGVEEGEEHGHHHEHAHDHHHEHNHHHEHEHSHHHGHDHPHHAHGHVHDHPDHDHHPDHTHPHVHRGMHEIEEIVQALPLAEAVKKDVLAVYARIAEAESQVHGVPVTDIHFHEVGTMDAIADITMVCLLLHRLAPEEIVVSPVHVGSGQVRCAHGILPVPAPATAYLLREVPIYGGEIKGELCTPTGAALLTRFATRFGAMPAMRTRAIGYGMGKKEFAIANCVRAMLGETEAGGDTVTELSCNVDDMTAEAIGFAVECLRDAGAREVYTVPVHMKKSRPGTLLCVLCTEAEKETFLRLLFQHTTTLGIRENVMRRYVLQRKTVTVDTPYGEVRRKDSTGYGVTRSKYEYDDLARIAKERGVGVEDVRRQLESE